MTPRRLHIARGRGRTNEEFDMESLARVDPAGNSDGCPNCVLNVEAPAFWDATIEGAIVCTYLCSDCGHEWTTEWRA